MGLLSPVTGVRWKTYEKIAIINGYMHRIIFEVLLVDFPASHVWLLECEQQFANSVIFQVHHYPFWDTHGLYSQLCLVCIPHFPKTKRLLVDAMFILLVLLFNLHVCDDVSTMRGLLVLLIYTSYAYLKNGPTGHPAISTNSAIKINQMSKWLRGSILTFAG